MRAADGVELHGVVTGPASDTTVVLVHGWTLDETCWAGVVDRLPGCRVVRYDHRGHGRSAAVDTATMTIEQLADDLAAVIEQTALAAYAQVPVHVMAGTRDRLTPVRYARRIREGLPQARLTLFPDAGHMLPLERTDGVANRIAALLDAPVGAH